MLAIQIDDKTIEDSLSAKFSNTKDIDKYIHDLLTKELEDTHFLAQIDQFDQIDKAVLKQIDN